MLAKANRVVAGVDYKSAVRRGRRRTTEALIVHIRDRGDSSVPRFGFIVAKNVGNAVIRNLVRRRLKGVAKEQLSRLPAGTDVVIRALPGASQASWASLNDQVAGALTKGGASR